MASRSGLVSTDTPGLFYREHPTRKIGKTRKKDRQWVIRQTLGGKTRLSTLGWIQVDGITEGEAIKTAERYRANDEYNQLHPELDELAKRPVCKADELRQAVAKKAEQERQQTEQQRKNLTINTLWTDHYLPSMETGNKKPRTIGSEKALYDTWLKKSIGSKRLSDLTTLDFARLSRKILNAKRSPRTVHYVVSVLLQIWGLAFDLKLIDIQPPRRKTLNLPPIDNEKTRAFTPEEARAFFEAIKLRSVQWHHICLLSLLTGLRASEIFKLEKQDIDLDRHLLFLRSPKKSRSQHLQISDGAAEHLKMMLAESPDDVSLLVASRKKGQIREVSDTVQRTIDELKLNEGREQREKLTFHSLRHTTATWLLEQGEDIYRVSKLLRHSKLAMTEQRYAHLSNETLKNTADRLASVLNPSESIVIEK
ncbi:MAG: hypothetical protein C0618_04405 [Desulfuromonas sp.]|nr:MAG: hypothetical protein C0618_04405 [Desulfuromonas sp.]